MSLHKIVFDRKAALQEGDKIVHVQNGAFGFDKINEVSIGFANECRSAFDTIENRSIDIIYKDHGKPLARCTLKENGDMRVSMGLQTYTTDKDGVVTGAGGHSDVSYETLRKVSTVAQSSVRVWHNYIKGAYDKDFAQQKMVKDIVSKMI
jgi:hypothetical protein